MRFVVCVVFGREVRTIIGCGYVGLTAAAIFANCGMTVYALEINPERLAAIKSGKSFFHEIGIDPLLSAATASGSLIATNDYAMAIPGSDIVFSCVGTPDNEDGSANLSYVFDAATQAVGLMKDDAIFVQKSTVPVGTGEQVETILAASDKRISHISYVSNPEFLRESTAIYDTLWFDRIVVGSDDIAATQAVLDLYKIVETCRDDLARLAGLTPPTTAPLSRYITTGRNSAELIKVSSNAFLALKISFANSIAKLADQTDADITEVMDAVGADPRIGRSFLNAGRGYGGGCFPKDVSSLIRSAEDRGVGMEIMSAASEVNDSMPHYIISRAEAAHGGSFKGKTVAVLGVAFKAGTSDVRRSPGIVIANTLAAGGTDVRVYDPAALALQEAKNDLATEATVTVCDSLLAAIQGTDCIFIATDWPEFMEIGLEGLAGMSGATLIVDCMNCLDASKVPAEVTYIGVGRH